MFWKDFLYICWSWLPALAHGKIEENTVNSGIFNGWGDKGIGSIVEHDITWCFRPVLWRQKCKVPCFEGNHCKNMETHSKNTGFGGLSRRRCLAIWNSAAWRASKGGKSWGVLWPVYLFHSPPYLELYINFQELYFNSQELYTYSQELYINSQEIYLESQEFQGLCIRYQHVCCMISDDFTNLVDLSATLLRRKLGNINFSSKVLAKLAGQSFFPHVLLQAFCWKLP